MARAADNTFYYLLIVNGAVGIGVTVLGIVTFLLSFDC